MGILNLTPDSFYDGGRYLDAESAQRRVDALLAEGAEILDLGAESTRPGSEPVAADEQIARLDPALRHAIGGGKALVSVDTADPRVAEHALGLGAHIINDVSCLHDPDLARVTAHADAVLIVMHARGPMSTMPGYSQYPERGYTDVVEDVRREWRAARERAVKAGLAVERIYFDPGIGYNKSARHSLELIGRLAELKTEGVPIVVGPSRKSFIASVAQADPAERLGGTIAACLACVARGASVVRVHDVHAVGQALALASAITTAAQGPRGARA